MQHEGAARKGSTVDFSDDPIIKAVQEYNIQYKNNKDWLKLRPCILGRLLIYPVEFTGEDQRRYTDYVAVIGENDENPRIYEDLRDLFTYVGSRIEPVWSDVDLLKIYLLILLAVLLIIASIIFALVPSGEKSLPLFVGLLGSIIGYLIGERRRTTDRTHSRADRD